MIKFNKCKLNSEILDQWVKTEVNVLLIGEKGVGKSHQIIETFNRNNLKYAYFSGATLDPWIHLLGIPKAKVMSDGTEKMEFILPENLDNNVEAIFCDEWNRTNKVVRNALLELQQFKSINGRKFPNLKMVWGAVNPPKDENEDSADYDVDELDPAQLDRFHIVVELPNEPDIKYFRQKFGEYHGKILVDWWKEQPKDALKILSPRRLDYVGECFKKGLDVKFLLPISANVKELVKRLSLDEKEELINQLLSNPDEEGMKVFLSDEKNVLKYKKKLKEPRMWNYWKYVKKELLSEEIKTDENFENYALYQTLLKEQAYRDVFVEFAKSNPKSVPIKILKALIDQSYIPEKNDLKSFISSEPNFVTVKPTNSKSVDMFSGFVNNWSITNIPKNYNPQSQLYMMNTNERRKGMEVLSVCWDKVPNKHHIINFMMANLSSMQKLTISSDKNFLPLFGNSCVLAKSVLNPDEIKNMISHINSNKQKISSNRINDYINYLNSSINEITVVPESFLKKLRDIRSVLSLSESKNDIVELLKL